MMEIISRKTKCDDIPIEEKDYYAVCANILQYIDNEIGEEFVSFDIDFGDELNIRIKRK